MLLKCAVLLIVGLVGCFCNEQLGIFNTDIAFADKMCPTDQVHFQKETRSAVACAKTCALAPDCRSVIFYHGNNTCYGLRSENPFSETSTLPGAVFYKAATTQTTTATQPTTTTKPTTTQPTTTTKPTSTQPTTTTQPTQTTQPVTTTMDPTTSTTTTKATTTAVYAIGPMVAGVGDSQLTADESFTGFEPHHAKLGNTGCWRIYPTTNHYIQVDFQSSVSVTAVTTQGCSAQNHWVTTYKVLTSLDCSTFTQVQGGQVFVGNTDASTPVTNIFDAPINARCLRINPLSVCTTFGAVISLRFDVTGRNL